MPTSTISSDLDRYRDAFDGQQQRDDPSAAGHEPPRSGCSQVAKGCGCVALVLLVAVVLGGVWVAVAWKGLAVGVAKRIAAEAIASAPLAEADRRQILERLDRVGNDFAAGRIDVEQMGRIFAAIAEGPLVPLALVTAADAKYVQPSGLDVAEKRAGRRILERLARGVITEKIEEADAKAIMVPVMKPDDEGGFTLKESLTDAELREFLAAAKAKVDDLGIPDQGFEVNIAAELDRAIDKALDRKAEVEPEESGFDGRGAPARGRPHSTAP